MNIIKIDGIKYVSLGDVFHLLSVHSDMAKHHGNLDEFKKSEIARIALDRFFTDLIEWDTDYDMDSDKDKKQMYLANLRNQYLGNRFVIKSKDDKGEVLCFRFWCDEAVEGEETPVFSADWKDARLYDDAAEAYHEAQAIKEATDGGIELTVQKAYSAFKGESDAIKLLDFIFGNYEIKVCEGAKEVPKDAE